MAEDEDKPKPKKKRYLTPSGRLLIAGWTLGIATAVTVPKMSWSGVADAASVLWDKARTLQVTNEEPQAVTP
jgi:hypothetical protein